MVYKTKPLPNMRYNGNSAFLEPKGEKGKDQLAMLTIMKYKHTNRADLWIESL